MYSPKCLSTFLIGNINRFLFVSLFLIIGIGIDLGTTYTRVFAPVTTFYNSTLTEHLFDVLCAIHPDGRAIETKVIEKSGYFLIGKSAVGKAAISGFKNSITKQESQYHVRIFISRLLEMIERLDVGPGNVSPDAKFVLDCSFFLNYISILYNLCYKTQFVYNLLFIVYQWMYTFIIQIYKMWECRTI